MPPHLPPHHFSSPIPISIHPHDLNTVLLLYFLIALYAFNNMYVPLVGPFFNRLQPPRWPRSRASNSSPGFSRNWKSFAL